MSDKRGLLSSRVSPRRRQQRGGVGQRSALVSKRQWLGDPYRDALHYRPDYGVSATDVQYKKAEEERKAFEDRQASQMGMLQSAYSQEKAALRQQGSQARSQLESARSKAEASIPGGSSLDAEYNKWQNTWVPVWVKSYGGQRVEKHMAPKSVIQNVGDTLLDQSPDYYSFYQSNGSYYIETNKNRDTSMERIYSDRLNRAFAEDLPPMIKQEFDTQVAPQLAERDTQIANLRGQASQMYSTKKAEIEGSITGGEAAIETRYQSGLQALQSQREERQRQLNAVKQQYQEKLSRVGGTLASLFSKGR